MREVCRPRWRAQAAPASNLRPLTFKWWRRSCPPFGRFDYSRHLTSGDGVLDGVPPTNQAGRAPSTTFHSR